MDNMTTCRFDNAIAGETLALSDLQRRISVHTPDDLPAAMAAIDAGRQEGCWTALLIDYSLGEWLEPALMRCGTMPARDREARLTALVFGRAKNIASRTPPEDPLASRILSLRPRMNFPAYARQMDKIKGWIEAGNVYQINYTFPIDVETRGCPASLYQTLLNRHPVAHAAYLYDEGKHVLSFSPELFLRREGTRLISRPMKGTAPRHADPDADWKAARILQNSAKDRAENAMIVDLLRNDMGKIARVGSVKVNRLFELESYPSIWTLTSTISADVGHASLLDILKALFPCGSVTGAPKVAAMRYIQALEHSDRGMYCGSVGWLAPNGDFSLNVAIRTLLLDDTGRGVYGVGGGIVLDSDPKLEWMECQWKSRILMADNAGTWTRRSPAVAS